MTRTWPPPLDPPPDISIDTGVRLALAAGLAALAAVFVLAVFGQLDIDDSKQRSPLTLPAPAYAVDPPVTVAP